MARLLLLMALLAPLLARAQGVPPGNRGVFTWEAVSNRRMDAESLAFGLDDSLYVSSDTVFVFQPSPAGPRAGRLRPLGRYGFGHSAILPLGVRGDTLLLGVLSGGRLSRSVDRGRTWTDVQGPNPGGGSGGPRTSSGFEVLPAGHPHAGRILAGGYLQYSDDRGATWREAVRSFPQNEGAAYDFAVLPSGRVLMGGEWGVAASDDGGASYAVTPLYGNYHFRVGILTALATPGSRQAGAPACGLADGTRCDGAIAIGIDATVPYSRMWRTADGGRSWSTSVPLVEPEERGYGHVAGIISLPPGPDGLGRALAVLGAGTVYRTVDGGVTWEVVARMPLDAAGGQQALYALLGPDGHLWVSTERIGNIYEGIYRSVEPATAALAVAGEAGPAEAPRGVAVSVRPNPASGRVSVVLTAAGAVEARVTVVDALGREVAVVWEGPLAPGQRLVSLETATWPAGVYVVRAEAGGRVTSARLVVTR